MKKLLYYTGLLFLAVWLFTIHSKFAFALDPLQNNESGFYDRLFIFLGLDAKIALPYIWGGAFSFATTVIIALLQRSDKPFWIFAAGIAMLELAGVFLFNYPAHGFAWMKIASIYYGIYAGVMVFLYIYISHSSQPVKQKIAMQKTAKVGTEKEMQIVAYLEAGKRPKEICEQFKIKPYQVTRIKQKYLK